MTRPAIDQPTGRLAQIIDAAWQLLATHPWEDISTRSLATTVGIKAPSLYKHVRTREDIATHLTTRALMELGEQLYQSLENGGGASELLATYREIVVQNPHLYRLLTGTDFPRDQLPAGLEEWAGTPFYLAAGRDPVRAQTLWAFAHGMAILEIDARFAGTADGSPAAGAWEAGAHALGS